MRTAKDIKRRANEIRNECIAACPHYADKLRTILIQTSVRMTRRAGQANYRKNSIQLSVPFFSDEGNFENGLRNTVTHEMAHLIVGVEGRNGQPHGPQWRRVHVALGGTGERCHSFDLADGYAPRATKPKAEGRCWKCGGIIQLGPTQLKRHRQFQAQGLRGYSHKKCLH